MSRDTILIQNAISKKVGTFIQLLFIFFIGFAVAFFQGWKLTLVMVATLSLLALSGGLMAMVMSKMSGTGQKAYAKAGTTVKQVVGSIQTVLSYTGEKRSVSEYDHAIGKVARLGINSALASGFGLDFALFVMFAGHGLIDDGLSGGKVLIVIFAVLTGGRSLDQASPCVQAFAFGKTAAYKMFKVIKRMPMINAYNFSSETIKTLKGDIELQNIYFTYPSRLDMPIF